MQNIEKLKPTGLFTNYIYKAIPLAFDESMSYYETLLGLLDYLKNTVIPTVNNNADAMIELQNLYTELHDYVEHYFDNLDVQEEINNKLDDMVEDGTLQEIIADYLNSKAIFGFDTVADMKNATNLIDGSYAKTLGFHTKNDGGASQYKIRTITNDDVVDEMIILSLSDENLIAELIESDKINVKQLGAYGDNIHDDTYIFKKAVNNFTTVFVPIGNYKITDSIEINFNTQIIGESMYNTVLVGATTEFIFKYLTEVKPNRWDIKTNILLKNFKCTCKNFLQLNNKDVANASWEYQASLLHVQIDSLFLIGIYNNITDPNKNTNILPTISELFDYGVAFDLNNLFDSYITNSQIMSFGLAVYLKGCDINKIELNRFTVNGCHIYTQGISTYGSQTMILNNDILANQRYGGIRINGTTGDSIENNYFETYTNASCYIYGDNENGLSIINNRITNPAINNITVVHLCPYRCDKMTNNRTSDRNYNMYVEIDYSKTCATSYPLDHRNNTVLNFMNNDTDLILKNKLLVLTENYNPLVVSPYNLYFPNSRIYGTAFMIQNPFLLDSTYNIYYFNNASGTGYINFTNAMEYYSKPLKIRYYYISSSATQIYHVVQVDGPEIKRGYLTGLTADSTPHYIDEDLSDISGNIGNNIILTLPTDATVKLLKVELL